MDIQLGWAGGVNSTAVGVLVADTSGTGQFTGIDTSPGDLLGETLTVGNSFGADDLILGTFTNTNFGSSRGFTLTLSGFTLPAGVDAGDDLAIYWFDGPASDPITAGQTGGFFRTNAVDLGNAPWDVPVDGSLGVNIFSFSPTYSGGIADSAFTANNFVVPEPSVLGLGAVCGALFLFRRRRRNN